LGGLPEELALLEEFLDLLLDVRLGGDGGEDVLRLLNPPAVVNLGLIQLLSQLDQLALILNLRISA